MIRKMKGADAWQSELIPKSILRSNGRSVIRNAASPIERWAFFLRNAEMLTPDDVERLFPDQEIVEAAGVLEMISQTPEERRMYDARLKFQRDQHAFVEEAVEEAVEKARAQALREGVLIGQIQALQQILGLPQSTFEDVSIYSNPELVEIRDQLQIQLRDRN
jgi:hypothetical protein